MMQKITPFIWLDTQAEEAVAFYLSVFKDGKIISTAHYPENGPRPAEWMELGSKNRWNWGQISIFDILAA
jgi:predicted 3-demethylubiquinone-9 3-methyltransferase (glyoxalase superfamily)